MAETRDVLEGVLQENGGLTSAGQFVPVARVIELEKSLERLRRAASAMCESFAPHADRCRICTANWQSLKAALDGTTRGNGE